jgi:hypothetical protein
MTGVEKEQESIKQTLQYFFDGLDNLDAESIKKAFYPQARSFCITSHGLGGMPVDNWNRVIESVKKDPEHPFGKEKSKKNVVYIDVTETAASAKVEWVFSEFMFTDYYNLLKIDGQWRIMNKVYHTTSLPDKK